MKRYLAVFNGQTLVISLVALISSVSCLYFHLTFSLDFLILDLMIFFPLTFTLPAAFRRRERALQYLSLYKASLLSIYYSFRGAKMDTEKKTEFENLAYNISDKLIAYLLTGEDAETVQGLSHEIFYFIRNNKKSVKRAFSFKIFLFMFRLNEGIEFVIATKRHRTPWGVRALVLFSIYMFVVFYPASLLYQEGFSVKLGYLFAMTEFKALLLISLYNVQMLLEDPFSQKGTDGIRLEDFRFSPVITPAVEAVAEGTPAMTIIEETSGEPAFPESKEEASLPESKEE